MQIHPACSSLPEMAAHEYAALVESVRKHWDSRYPILTYEGQILDGRHRWRACQETGVTPTFIEWDRKRCDGNPFRFVWEEHDARRNWHSAEQRLFCLKRCESGAQEWEKAAERTRKEANQARSEAAKGNQNAAKLSDEQRVVEKKEQNSEHTTSVRTVSNRSSTNATANAIAQSTGTNRGAVQRVAKMVKLAEELGQTEVLDDVADGRVKAHAALKTMEEEKRRRALTAPVEANMPDGIIRGDFRKMSEDIPDNSVELILTDPPYDSGSVQLYEDAARIAARILKPGGSLIAYSGQRHLPEVLAGMSKHMRYWWTIACVHEGGNQMLQKLGIRCGWKPLVWFVKGTRGDVSDVILDTISGSREKHHHEWQQSLAEATAIIDKLSSKNGLVVDFCLGGGTVAVAAKELGRPFIGYEISADAINATIRRLGDEA